MLYQYIECIEGKKMIQISPYWILKLDEKYYIKDKKNKIKAKNGVITY